MGEDSEPIGEIKMSTIPRTRNELISIIQANYAKLNSELESAGSDVSKLKTEDNWTVKELLAVRAWWTDAVVKWVQAGQEGEHPITPAKGYSWKDTTKLNNEIAKKSKKQSYKAIRGKLDKSYSKLLETIDSLDDHELMDLGVFEWAGEKWPVSRWLSVNTARQYVTARKFIRKAIKETKW